MASTNVFVEKRPRSARKPMREPINKRGHVDVIGTQRQNKKSTSLPSLRAPASPLMTVTGLEGFVQNWCNGGKKASLLFSSWAPDRKQEVQNRWSKYRMTYKMYISEQKVTLT